MDWNDLQDAATLDRFVAHELKAGTRPRPLFTRIVDMGVQEERARAVITKIRAQGPDEVLRRQRPARRVGWAIAAAMILGGIALIVAGATRVDVDDMRWPTFAITGAGLLLAAFGVTRASR